MLEHSTLQQLQHKDSSGNDAQGIAQMMLQQAIGAPYHCAEFWVCMRTSGCLIALAELLASGSLSNPIIPLTLRPLPCLSRFAAHPEVSTNGLMRRSHERVLKAIQRKLRSFH